MAIHAYFRQHFCKLAEPLHLKQRSPTPTPSTIPASFSGPLSARALNRLPFEIFVEIFSHCPTDFPRLGSQVPPLTLALVCKTWHYLVTHTPCLWSCFELVLEGTGSSQSEKDEMKRKLSLWLHRSRRQPLSFRIIHGTVGTALDMRSAELLDILLPHAPRWQHVSFHGPGGAITPLLGKLPRESLRTLRSIALQFDNSWNSNLHISRLEIPWSQLSALDLQIYQESIHSLDECFKILSAAKNLTSCTMNADCGFTLSQDAGRLVLPSLRSLKLIIQANDPAGAAESSFLTFLECLSLTDLRAFTLEWLVHRSQGATGSQWRAVHPRFVKFIHSSAASLEDLGLAYLPLRDYEIIRYVDGLAKLKTLDLKFALTSHQPDPITYDLLHHLTPSNSFLPPVKRVQQKGAGYCLPELRVLKFQCSGEYLNQAMLLSLVEGRAAMKLKAFGLFTLKGLSKEFRDRIGILKDRGFDFSVSTLNVR